MIAESEGENVKILVTGGSGKLGQFVVADLASNGHDVVNADRRPPDMSFDGVQFVQTDLHDVGQIAGAMRDCEAVIHLGAIPQPYGHPDEVVFRNNTRATFSVLHSASLLGIKRVAFASSVSGYGTAWSPVPTYHLYAPVDEKHPMVNLDAYGLSKEVDERTAQMFVRRDGMQIAGLRFHWVAAPDELAAIAPDGIEDPSRNSRTLWGYVDARDAATISRLAVEAEFDGFEPFNVTAADTLADQPTEHLIAEYLPDTRLREPIPGFGSGYAIEKAERELGWKPRYSWRTIPSVED